VLVPEAPIYENNFFLSNKCYIWATSDILSVEAIPEAKLGNQSSNGYFGLGSL
jgi:hypothetical protein